MRVHTAMAATLLLSSAAAWASETPALARRCNAVAWVVPAGSADDVPPALRKIERELMTRKRGTVQVVVASLPHSLHLRRIAPRVLAGHPCDAARRALQGLIRDKDEHVAREAADALGVVGGREVIPSLRWAARAAPATVRHNAINALSSLGAADRAADVLIRALDAQDASVVCSALDALSTLRGEAFQRKALARIEQLLQTPLTEAVARCAKRAQRVLRARL